MGDWVAKLPVVIDVPRNHSGAFHVLFNDGSIAFLSLENCTSIKRIAGFLHTKFNYGEEEFRDLIKRISQLEDTAR